ncbi:hypothetical protein MN0502_33770 (plasmid) [Arthrobacter sp. MN05-02]|nr:hypothetical protein MN0502_33770 [Arthrobacter sp. MN05-02]
MLIFMAIHHAGLAVPDVWLRYFSLSGMVDEYEVNAYLHGLVVLPPVQCDLIAHAVNELIDELPRPSRAPYSSDIDP